MSDDDKPTGMKVVRLGVPPNEMKKAVLDFRKTLPDLIEFNNMQAELWRKKYQALIEQGFTPAEALELCCK